MSEQQRKTQTAIHDVRKSESFRSVEHSRQRLRVLIESIRKKSKAQHLNSKTDLLDWADTLAEISQELGAAQVHRDLESVRKELK